LRGAPTEAPIACVLVATVGMLCVPSHAATPAVADPAPGEYVTEQGWGTMRIARRGPALTFSIDAVGANVHICTLEGSLRKAVADLEGSDRTRCEVRFTPTHAGIEVTSNGEPCRAYCGARAGFEGLYLRPAPGCTPTEVTRTRAEFKRRYDRKAYAEARDLLTPVADRCAKTLLWSDTNWIANDLAITLHRLGDRAGCLARLEPIRDVAETSDDELRGGHPPSDAEIMIGIARATRTNLKLCRAGR